MTFPIPARLADVEQEGPPGCCTTRTVTASSHVLAEVAQTVGSLSDGVHLSRSQLVRALDALGQQA